MFLSETEDWFLESSESLQSCVAKDLFHESFEAFRRMNNIDPICIRSNFIFIKVAALELALTNV